MKTYRYKVVKSTNKEISESKMNEFGRRGFELCSAIKDEFGYIYYFKIESND